MLVTSALTATRLAVSAARGRGNHTPRLSCTQQTTRVPTAHVWIFNHIDLDAGVVSSEKNVIPAHVAPPLRPRRAGPLIPTILPAVPLLL